MEGRARKNMLGTPERGSEGSKDCKVRTVPMLRGKETYLPLARTPSRPFGTGGSVESAMGQVCEGRAEIIRAETASGNSVDIGLVWANIPENTAGRLPLRSSKWAPVPWSPVSFPSSSNMAGDKFKFLRACSETADVWLLGAMSGWG